MRNFLIPLRPDCDALIAVVTAAGRVQDGQVLKRAPRPPLIETEAPRAADFGLTAGELGMWGRLRATGLSPKDAADVVKAARMEGRP